MVFAVGMYNFMAFSVSRVQTPIQWVVVRELLLLLYVSSLWCVKQRALNVWLFLCISGIVFEHDKNRNWSLANCITKYDVNTKMKTTYAIICVWPDECGCVRVLLVLIDHNYCLFALFTHRSNVGWTNKMYSDERETYNIIETERLGGCYWLFKKITVLKWAFSNTIRIYYILESESFQFSYITINFYLIFLPWNVIADRWFFILNSCLWSLIKSVAILRVISSRVKCNQELRPIN